MDNRCLPKLEKGDIIVDKSDFNIEYYVTAIGQDNYLLMSRHLPLDDNKECMFSIKATQEGFIRKGDIDKVNGSKHYDKIDSTNYYNNTYWNAKFKKLGILEPRTGVAITEMIKQACPPAGFTNPQTIDFGLTADDYLKFNGKGWQQQSPVVAEAPAKAKFKVGDVLIHSTTGCMSYVKEIDENGYNLFNIEHEYMEWRYKDVVEDRYTLQSKTPNTTEYDSDNIKDNSIYYHFDTGLLHMDKNDDCVYRVLTAPCKIITASGKVHKIIRADYLTGVVDIQVSNTGEIKSDVPVSKLVGKGIHKVMETNNRESLGNSICQPLDSHFDIRSKCEHKNAKRVDMIFSAFMSCECGHTWDIKVGE